MFIEYRILRVAWRDVFPARCQGANDQRYPKGLPFHGKPRSLRSSNSTPIIFETVSGNSCKRSSGLADEFCACMLEQKPPFVTGGNGS
jgi:hypothetical protein